MQSNVVPSAAVNTCHVSKLLTLLLTHNQPTKTIRYDGDSRSAVMCCYHRSLLKPLTCSEAAYVNIVNRTVNC
jgi:hypothetical protein